MCAHFFVGSSQPPGLGPQAMVEIIYLFVAAVVYCRGLFGLSGMLPFKYTQALMGGQGLGGIVTQSESTVMLYVSDYVCQSASHVIPIGNMSSLSI